MYCSIISNKYFDSCMQRLQPCKLCSQLKIEGSEMKYSTQFDSLISAAAHRYKANDFRKYSHSIKVQTVGVQSSLFVGTTCLDDHWDGIDLQVKEEQIV